MTSTLPQPNGPVFLTEGGLETELIFHDGLDLPDFASFPLVETAEGRALLRRYYESFVAIAKRDGAGIVFETPTWRANTDWGLRLGYSVERLDGANRRAVELLKSIQARHADDGPTIVVSGNLGPRGDGYVVDDAMTADQAAAYHSPQIRSFAVAGADAVSGLTLTYTDEAIGMAMAAREAGMPIVLSFTVETDGLLPSGQPLDEAITQVDRATAGYAAYFMVNCAHPSHFLDVVAGPGPWDRLGGIRANASKMSHAELDEAVELDRGDEDELAHGYLELRGHLPQLSVFGGCCGTDHLHIDAISSAMAAA